MLKLFLEKNVIHTKYQGGVAFSNFFQEEQLAPLPPQLTVMVFNTDKIYKMCLIKMFLITKPSYQAQQRAHQKVKIQPVGFLSLKRRKYGINNTCSNWVANTVPAAYMIVFCVKPTNVYQSIKEKNSRIFHLICKQSIRLICWQSRIGVYGRVQNGLYV